MLEEDVLNIEGGWRASVFRERPLAMVEVVAVGDAVNGRFPALFGSCGDGPIERIEARELQASAVDLDLVKRRDIATAAVRVLIARDVARNSSRPSHPASDAAGILVRRLLGGGPQAYRAVRDCVTYVFMQKECRAAAARLVAFVDAASGAARERKMRSRKTAKRPAPSRRAAIVSPAEAGTEGHDEVAGRATEELTAEQLCALLCERDGYER